MICKQCGNDYDRIGHHWSQSKSCSIPQFTDRQHEVIVGSLMGDGALDSQNGRDPRVTIAVQKRRYIEYLQDILQPLCGEIYKSNNLWWISTRNHGGLEKYASWYDSGNKLWPSDLQITPTILRHLYAQDGSTQHRASPIARVCTRNEQENREKVSEIIKTSGLPAPTWDEHQFRCSVEDSQDVFKFMEHGVAGYEHKWPEEYR